MNKYAHTGWCIALQGTDIAKFVEAEDRCGLSLGNSSVFHAHVWCCQLQGAPTGFQHFVPAKSGANGERDG